MRRLLCRPIVWGLAISLALHLLLLIQTEIPLPDWNVANEPIDVALVPAPQPTKPLPPPKTVNRPKPVVKSKPVPQVRHEPPPPPQIPAAVPAVTAAAQTEAPIQDKPQQAADQEAAHGMLPLPEIPDEPVAVLPAPKRVEIEFKGMNGSTGKGKQVFERRDDSHYVLNGKLSKFFSIDQYSEGFITPNGLQPVTFRQHFGFTSQSATFDWNKNRVVMDTGKRTDTVDLPPGTQDMLSFMYQFMFVPPLDEMRLNMVTGKKLATYVYTFEGEETLDTPMGKLQTLHIGRNNRDGDEKVELWLATEYRYLPVRIRRTEKGDVFIDLVVTRLTLTE